jgi:[protein-PII] uridylyltransferase
MDRPGLLWRICGVLALHGLNILEARVYTGDKDLVLDLFQVTDTFEPEIRAEKLEAIRRDILLAVDGKLALGYRLAEKLRHYSQPKSALSKIQTRVVVDNAASDDYTIVEVFAPDRLGLLYTIARTLSDMHLDIHLAKVSTRGHEAIDAFYVRDPYAQKVTDPEHLKEIEKTILFELGRDI